MSETIEVRVPDIGDFKDVPVIEVLVKAGDRVKKNDSLITLESEKASMEVPAESDGVVADVRVKVGDKVSKGATILVLESAASAQPKPAAAAPPATPPAPAPVAPPAQTRASGNGLLHASPTVRRYARERGLDLHEIRGTGPSGRITRDDVESLLGGARGGGATALTGLPPWPKVDFAQYGEIERKP